jgi:hypothetical protein
MWPAIRHWVRLVFLDDKIRPFDWLMLLIEVLVLAVIAHEAVYRPWKIRRWLRTVFQCFLKGQALENSAPATGSAVADEDTIKTWKNAVQDWVNQTWRVLNGYSPQAAAAFLHGRVEPGLSFSHVPHAHDCHNYYLALLARMESLRSIMEKPDVYS